MTRTTICFTISTLPLLVAACTVTGGASSMGFGDGGEGGEAGAEEAEEDGETDGQDTEGDDETEGDGAAVKFDVGFEDEQSCPAQAGGAGSYDFSTIWIANSPEGTVSKIDTRTGDELARYKSGPGNADPSRTSVNLSGNVAVANRGGSVTMIATRVEECVDRDNDQQIRTSQGRDDVLPWGEDECVIWHHDLPFADDNHQGGPRAIAWDGGTAGADPCADSDARVWVGWRAKPDDAVVLRRLDGRTGELDAEVTVESWDGNWGHGTYGGAVDANNDFWGMGTKGTLVRVDGETLEVSRYDNPGTITYGVALDSDGDPWLAGYDGHLYRFDAETESFEDHGAVGPDRLRGLAIDANGYAWIAGNQSCSLVQYDIETGEVVDGSIALPGCSTPVGVSIDVDGFVWVVDKDASVAFKVDPETYDVDTIEGLVSPYTYSDMTGAGLNLVFNPPG